MSIAILNQAFDETRRLAIAGSNLAKDDFRLKKLVPPLQAAGDKVPVFAQVAKSIEAVINATEQTAAQALLDLSSLLVAILYTQGNTTTTGDLQPLDNIEFDIGAAQASARVLKPLIESLTTTGSGRLNTIEEAFEMGAFNDLRLVNHSLAALDDKYGEIGDFVAEKILPTYGTAIVPQIKHKIDVKGSGGSVRRLKLLYQLDPVAARPIVLEAFDKGNKDMKIAALGCLGDSVDDLPLLLEQATSKNRDVRRVAFGRMANFSDEPTVALFSTALDGADLEIVTDPISRSTSKKLIDLVLSKTDEAIAAAPKLKSEKDQKSGWQRVELLLNCFFNRSDKPVVEFLKRLFQTGSEWLPSAKSMNSSRENIEANLSRVMLSTLEPSLLKILAENFESADIFRFRDGLLAARIVWKPTAVFDQFHSFYIAEIKSKKKDNTPAERRELISNRLASYGQEFSYYYGAQQISEYRLHQRLKIKLADANWDPRWLDAAIDNRDLPAVLALADAKNKNIQAFVNSQFDLELRKSNQHQINQLLELAIKINHEKSAQMLLAAIQKLGASNQSYQLYWLVPLISKLPKKSVAEIEAAIPSLPDKIVEEIMPHLQTLKTKSK